MLEPIQLLVLDFEGVCTLSTAELIAAGAPTRFADSVRPEAEAIVRHAQGLHIPVMVLSNEIDPGWSELAPILKLVDRVVACSDNGILKPDRRAFQRCLLLAGVTAEQTLLVDDQADNITVAASLGIHTVLFDTGDPQASWLAVRAELDR